MNKWIAAGLIAAGVLSGYASASQGRGISVHNTPCAEDEVLAPTDYRAEGNSWYSCQQSGDFSIQTIKQVEGLHDEVTCRIVVKKPRHWRRHHGLKVVATEMCHH